MFVSMVVNFHGLTLRIMNANKGIDFEKLKLTLDGIKGNVYCIGTGGSYAVSKFGSNVFESCNKAHADAQYPRDLLYRNLSKTNDVCAFTYSGKTPSIIKALEECEKYNIRRTIFTAGENKLRQLLTINDNDQIINYGSENDSKELSFISIASTLMPMSILLRYALNLNYEDLNELIDTLNWESEQYIKDQFKDVHFDELLLQRPNIEILTGDRTYTAAHILESNLIESGIGYTIILHEKNDYGHGRSVLNYNHRTPVLIYLINGEESGQDKVLLEKALPSMYERVFIVRPNYGDILGEFDLAMKAMYLSKKIAEDLDKDLSIVEYPKMVKIINPYDGQM